MELKDIKRATLFLSFNNDYAFLFLIDNNRLFATDENNNIPEVFDTSSYFDSIEDYCCWSENISNDYQSFKQMAESIVNDFVEARIEEFEGDPNCLADDNKYTVTVFVGEEKVYEEDIFCK